jgi:hypothetical protein
VNPGQASCIALRWGSRDLISVLLQTRLGRERACI